MSSDQNGRTALGLDIGTSRVVLARQNNGGYEFRSEMNAFVSLAHTRMTEKALRSEGVAFTVRNGEILVHGNEAPRFADMLNVEPRRPMRQGMLNPDEEESVRVVRHIVETLAADDAAPGRRIYYSVPSAPRQGDEALTYHDATLRQIFEEKGWEAHSINEGLAVVYAELEETNYTGIGISCGGGLCNVSVAYLSMPSISISVPKAGDFIDSSAASVTGDLANRVRLAKEESFHFNGHCPDKLQQVLTVYYDDVIRALITAMVEAFAGNRRLPRFKRPVPIVLSGGTSAPAGFRDRFETLLADSDFPIEVSEVRMAKDPLHATAKGALLAALTEA